MTASPDDPTAGTDCDAITDEILLVRIQRGDEAAFAQLLDRYYRSIVVLANHYVHSADVASDLAQDVFVKFWERRATLNQIHNAAHYLRQAARNAALNVLKHERIRDRLRPELQGEYHAAASQHHATHDAQLEHADLQRQLQQALHTFPPRLREVATLYFEAGLTPQDIAGALGTAAPTVYGQLRKIFITLARAVTQGKIDI